MCAADRQAVVGGIAVAGRVAAELEPAVRRDGDRRVAGALDRERERQRGVRRGVVPGELREAAQLVRARQHPCADRLRRRCAARREQQDEGEHGRSERATLPPGALNHAGWCLTGAQPPATRKITGIARVFPRTEAKTRPPRAQRAAERERAGSGTRRALPDGRGDSVPSL